MYAFSTFETTAMQQIEAMALERFGLTEGWSYPCVRRVREPTPRAVRARRPRLKRGGRRIDHVTFARWRVMTSLSAVRISSPRRQTGLTTLGRRCRRRRPNRWAGRDGTLWHRHMSPALWRVGVWVLDVSVQRPLSACRRLKLGIHLYL